MTTATRALSVLILMAFAANVVRAGGVIEQGFPAGLAPNFQTKWRVTWDIEKHNGGSETLVIKEAVFSRAPGDDVKVLGDTRLAEIFVPYNDGTRIYDISQHLFYMIDVGKSDLGPDCLGPGRIFDRRGGAADKGPVAVEVHDGHLRWMNGQNKTRRGQVMLIWSVLNGANYRYIMLYMFSDDGVVHVRLGATAHNIESSNADGTTHLHSGCWRVSPVLNDANQLALSEVSLNTQSGSPQTEIQPINTETGVRWSLDRFTRVRAQSKTVKNTHSPTNFIAYELIPAAAGVGRYNGVGEDFTQSDFWVTRARSTELAYVDLPTYANAENLSNSQPLLWFRAAVLHRPRDEDFGFEGYNASQGVAITAWAGFDLKPVNLFRSTPLYP